MVAANSSRSKRISSGLKQTKKLTPVTADHMPYKLLDGRMDTKQECKENSEYVSEELETHAQLKASIKKLRMENSMSCQEIREISESCLRLTKKNRRLLKQLKEFCTADTIAYLNAQNPETRSVDHLKSERNADDEM